MSIVGALVVPVVVCVVFECRLSFSSDPDMALAVFVVDL